MNPISGFVGRARELELLADDLEGVRTTGRGALVVVQGRRRVGKSRLVEELVRHSGLPSVSFLATRQRPAYELARFADAMARSTHPQAAASAGVRFESWEAALTFASVGATREHPVVIVIDELPYLLEAEPGRALESQINAAWEQTLMRLPVMLILVGSDLSVMRLLTDHGHPLYGRPTRTLTVEPLDAGEVADARGLSGAAAIDAYHVVGGFPRLMSLWRPTDTLRSFLGRALDDADAPFVATGQRILDAEFPGDVQARTVLSVIGSGERTYGSIAEAAGVSSTNLRRSLDLLEHGKRVVASERPLSTRPSRDTRYHVSDPFLRFHLRFIDPILGDLERGRRRQAIDRIVRGWQTYIGAAVEPFVRASIERLLPDVALPGADRVGGYWTRTNDPQVHLVGMDERGRNVAFVGSIKWRADQPFDAHDATSLRAVAIHHPRGGVPGVGPGTVLVGVSRGGFADRGALARAFGPDDLLESWRAARPLST